MKKIFLSLIPAIALLAVTGCKCNTCDTATDANDSAADCTTATISLKEAFDAISKLPDLTVKAPDYNLPVISDFVENGSIAAAYNLDAAQIRQSGNAVFDILNKVPLTEMINGGNNNNVAAFVYAEPNSVGSNDILIVAMSGYRGSVVAMYGTTNDTCKAAIQNTKLEIQGDFLSLEAESVPDVGDFNIILSKAR